MIAEWRGPAVAYAFAPPSSNSGSLAIFAAIRRAASRATTSREGRPPPRACEI